MSDFEDALQVAVALAGGASVIVSENIEDYRAAPIRVVTPQQILAELGLV